MNWNQRFARRTGAMKRTAVRELLSLTAQPGMISFAGGLPAAELFPLGEIRRAAETVFSRAGKQALQYGETEGVGELRDWIAQRFSRPQFRLDRKNVLIVSGAQQALDLIGRVLLDEGDAVIVENPTYLALLSVWRPLGVRFLTVESDAAGMRVEELEALFSQRPKLIYAVPNFQNPQGTTLAWERRQRLVDLLKDQEIGLVEDDPYGELRYEGGSMPTLCELAAVNAAGAGMASPVIHAGTFSKVLTPGLRVGWVIAEEAVIDRLARAKQAADLHTGTLSQWLALELVRDGLLERHVPRLRDAYRERRDAMLAALEHHFPADITWTRPEGGMFLMVTLPSEWNAGEVLVRALAQRVAFVPGEDFHLERAGGNTLRLNFSNATPELIREGVARLCGVLEEYRRAQTPGSSPAR